MSEPTRAVDASIEVAAAIVRIETRSSTTCIWVGSPGPQMIARRTPAADAVDD